jgi:DNA-binding transcriptional ArsR family regulator
MDHDFEERCETHCVHQDKVIAAKRQMCGLGDPVRLAELFKTMGDPTRLRIIYALMNQELCVCDLAAVTGASESAVSHQLRRLRQQQLVKYRREGKMLYYSLQDNHVMVLMKQGLEHINE